MNLFGDGVKVRIGVDDSEFNRGMSRAQRRLQEFSSTLRRTLTVATAAASAGLVMMTRRSMQLVDQQAKLARSLDTSVASVQVLGRAADLAGVSAGELQQGLVQLTRRLSQAAAGGGPAADAIERIGLSLDDLIKMDAAKRVEAIQRAIASTVPAAQRAAVAAQIFGDRASFAFSRIDPETLAQANEELTRMGALVSDIDAAQIEKANDAMSGLQAAATALSTKLAIELAPTIENIAKAMSSWNISAEAVTGSMGALVGLRLGLVFGPLGAVIGTVAGAMIGMSAATKKQTVRLGDAKRAEDLLRAAMELSETQTGWSAGASEARATSLLDHANAALLAAQAERLLRIEQSGGESAFIAGGGVPSTLDAINDLDQQIVSLLNTIADLERAKRGYENVTRTYTEFGDSQAEGAEMARLALERLRAALADPVDNALADALSDLELAFAAGEINLEEYETLLAQIHERFGEIEAAGGGVARSLEIIEKAAGEAQTALQSMVDSLARGFSDWLVSGFKDFRGFLKGLVNSFKQAVAQMIATALSARLGQALGLGGGGSVIGTAASAATGGGGMLGGLLGGFGAAASGGTAAVAGSGFLGGLGASLGIGGASGLSGGLFSIGANAGLAGGGFMATLGAAAPLIALGIGIISLFNSNKASKADTRAIIKTLEGVNQTIGVMGNTSRRAAKHLIDLAGGLDEFQKQTGAYFDLFFTDAEKLARVQEQINEVFSKLNVSVPDTRAEFRSIVESLDLTTKSGRSAFDQLMKISPAFAQITDAARSMNDALSSDPFATREDMIRAAAAISRGGELSVTGANMSGVQNIGAVVTMPQAIASTNTAVEANTGLMARLLRRQSDTFDRWDINGLPGTRT